MLQVTVTVQLENLTSLVVTPVQPCTLLFRKIGQVPTAVVAMVNNGHYAAVISHSVQAKEVKISLKI